jgi:hypothetical protein
MKLVLLSDIIVCHHPSVSLNKEKICREISEDKIAVCKKTQGLHGKKRRARCLTGLNNVLLPTLFTYTCQQY